MQSHSLFSDKSANASLPSSYAINLAWINPTLELDQPYIFPCKTKEELVEKFLGRAQKWQAANPDALVQIWYDGEFCTQEAITATQVVLQEYAPDTKIKLRNIRDIAVVKANPDSFSDMVPVYVRVDLTKLILCAYSIEEDQMQSAIFSDLDVGERRPNNDRMDKAQLFNPGIMKKLQEFGFELGSDGWKPENQFIQLWNKPEALLAINLTINASLMRITTVLNYAKKKNKDMLRHLNSGTVFVPLIRQTAKLLCGFLNSGAESGMQVNLQVFDLNRQEEWVPYDPFLHGCAPLGNFYLGATGGDLCVFLEQDGNEVFELAEAFIKLPSANPAVKMGRDDMDTRHGASHAVSRDLRELVNRVPANGDTYQCSYKALSPQKKEAEVISFQSASIKKR